MKCQKCGSSNSVDSSFCVSCGARLAKEILAVESPGQRAKEVGEKFNLLIKGLSRGEKLVAAGAVVSIFSFFMPWLVLSKEFARPFGLTEEMMAKDFGDWTYLLPLLMVGVLVLLCLSKRAAAKVKIRYSSYWTIIGTFFASVGMFLNGVMNWFVETISRDIENEKELFSLGSGWWLLFLGSLAVVAGAFLTERENLK